MSRYPQNTYVGMRYVPLFEGEWNNAKDYEPLTVVSLDGNSYTSKTFVPAGVNPVGNPDYWAETGNYNAQIEAYRQEVLQYNTRIQANADAIATLETKEDADILKLTNEKKKDVWSGIVITIGDSYLEGYTPSGTVKSWGSFIKDKKKIPTSRYISKYKGGIGFSQSVDGINFSTLFDSALVGIDSDDVSLIIIAGGYNDGSDNTSNSIVNLVKKCKEKCKNSEVYIGYCGYGASEQSPYQKAAGYRYPQSAIIGGGHNLGNLAEILKVNNSTAMEGHHPNVVGEEMLADSIINIVDNGVFFEYSLPHINPEYTSETKPGGTFISVNRGAFSLHFYGENIILFDTGSSRVHNLEFAKITFKRDDINFHGDKFLTGRLHGFCKTNENKYYPCSIAVLSTEENNTLSLRATALMPDGSNYLNNVTEFTIESGSVYAPLGLL